MRAALSVLLFCATGLQGADLALTGATVYPAPNARPIRDAVVLIHDGRIAAVGPRRSAKIPNGAQVLDCSNQFVVAGFWNSHVHIFTPVLLHARDASAVQLNEQLDTMLNRWGFTSVFDIASMLANTLAIRRRIESGELRGPRILTVGEPLWTVPPIYVGDYLISNHIEIPVVTSPHDATVRVATQATEGANGVKLFTGSVQANGRVANMPLAVVSAAVREAHRRNLPVFAHPQNVEGLEVAIRGGVDILAHTAPDSPPWTPAFVERLNRAHMALIPTLNLFDFEARKAGASDEDREQWINKMVGELRAYSPSGGEVLFGTDIGYTDHYDTALEFQLMSRAGMSFGQVLASLTTNPARRFGYAERTGRVEKGMDADLVVLEDDPAKDVTALSRVRLTIRQGVVVYPGR